MAADTTTELNRGTDRAAPAAAEGERSGLARWAMAVAVAALVVAVASPVWVPMLRTAPQAAPDPAVAAAIAAAEQAARAARDTADKAVPLAVRIDVLEQAVQKLAAANATAVASPDIRRLALAGAVAQLRPAVSRPTPFAVELAVVAGLAQGQEPYATALRQLGPLAGTGVPTARQLRLRFPGQADAALMAEAGTDEVPLLAQFVTWMASTAPFGSGQVINELTMPATTAALQRAREQVDADDLAGALAALDGLSGTAATAMRPWTDGARARLAATAAMEVLVRSALAELPASAR